MRVSFLRLVMLPMPGISQDSLSDVEAAISLAFAALWPRFREVESTEWWAGIPIISKGPKQLTWLRQEAGKECPASLKYSHLAEGRWQGQTQFLRVLKHCLNRKVCMWKDKNQSLGSELQGTAKLLQSLCRERTSTMPLMGEPGTFISVRGNSVTQSP